MKPNLIAAGIVASLIAASSPALALAQPASADQAGAVARGPVEVVVWNIRKSLGHVRVAICTKLTFANSKRVCPYHGEAEAHAGAITVVVPDVPAGAYAAQVYQDEKDINRLERGPLGVPMEGVGFSNDASVNLTGPRFNEASFAHDPATPVALRIKLRYFPDL